MSIKDYEEDCVIEAPSTPELVLHDVSESRYVVSISITTEGKASLLAYAPPSIRPMT